MTATLRLGSRRSPMAVAQSRQVAGMITERTGRQVEIVGVTTLGDVSRAELAACRARSARPARSCMSCGTGSPGR
jgi:porphobilinogen deaminase